MNTTTQHIDDYLDRQAYWSTSLSTLTDRELHALILWLNGATLADSAVILGVCVRRVAQLRDQARVKLARAA